MWTRREKPKQIADRWQTLAVLLENTMGAEWTRLSLEGRVVGGFSSRRYANKEFVLKLSSSCPIYAILFLQMLTAATASTDRWRLPVILVVVVADLRLAFQLFRKPTGVSVR
jgi:hypothetical protein